MMHCRVPGAPAIKANRSLQPRGCSAALGMQPAGQASKNPIFIVFI
jgi:hypothetical protein